MWVSRCPSRVSLILQQRLQSTASPSCRATVSSNFLNLPCSSSVLDRSRSRSSKHTRAMISSLSRPAAAARPLAAVGVAGPGASMPTPCRPRRRAAAAGAAPVASSASSSSYQVMFKVSRRSRSTGADCSRRSSGPRQPAARPAASVGHRSAIEGDLQGQPTHPAGSCAPGDSSTGRPRRWPSRSSVASRQLRYRWQQQRCAAWSHAARTRNRMQHEHARHIQHACCMQQHGNRACQTTLTLSARLLHTRAGRQRQRRHQRRRARRHQHGAASSIVNAAPAPGRSHQGRRSQLRQHKHTSAAGEALQPEQRRPGPRV